MGFYSPQLETVQNLKVSTEKMLPQPKFDTRAACIRKFSKHDKLNIQKLRNNIMIFCIVRKMPNDDKEKAGEKEKKKERERESGSIALCCWW